MIALLEAKKVGLLHPKFIFKNLISGTIVGVVSLPLSMAFAIASGAKPEQGLYTAIIASFLVSIFGGSRLQIAGPTGAFVVVLSAITAQYGIGGLQVATLMAGVILLLMGVAKLGAIVKFIPDPVIVGFTSGIAIIIWVGQWRDFFGLPAVSGEHFHTKLAHLLQVLPQLDRTTTAMSLGCLAILIIVPRIPHLKRIPAPLVALVVATGLQGLFQFEGLRTIGSAFGGIPTGLPRFEAPELSLSVMVTLIGPAFTIAMLGSIESLLSAVVADGMAGTRHNSNQELIGQGLANMVAPFLGGFAATGAIARTATNIRNGANSPLSGIVHALVLVLILLFLAPLVAYVPLAALSAILFIVAWNMSEVKHLVHIAKRAPRADVVILFVTLGLTVFADLVVAVNIGVILAMLQFLRRMSQSVEVRQVSNTDLRDELGQRIPPTLPHDLVIFAVEGPVFFGAVETLESMLMEFEQKPKIAVLRFKWVPFIDITGLQALEETVRSMNSRGIRVFLTGANPRVAGKLKRAGILPLLASEKVELPIEQVLLELKNLDKTSFPEDPSSDNPNLPSEPMSEQTQSYFLESVENRMKGN